jgi:acetyl esterase/lipase
MQPMTDIANEGEILMRDAPAADARIAFGNDALQFGDLRVPRGDGPHPVVIVAHGGFWRARYDLLHIGHLCAALTERGYATWNLEYRRVGHAGGGWPGTCEDVLHGAEHLARMAAEWPLDLERVAAIGHSAGGHLVCWLAAEHARLPLGLRGVVSLAGVVDLREAVARNLGDGATQAFLGDSDDYEQASPMERLPLGVPQVLIHGELDDVVPIELVRGYAARAAQEGDQLIVTALPTAGHFAVIDPTSQAWPAVLGAVESLL